MGSNTDIDLLNAFDESGIDPSYTVVRCETQDEADIFLEYLALKKVWGKKDIITLKEHWKDHGSKTCYHFSQNRWCYDDYYREYNPEFEIVNFFDIYKEYQTAAISDVSYSYDELFE